MGTICVPKPLWLRKVASINSKSDFARNDYNTVDFLNIPRHGTHSIGPRIGDLNSILKINEHLRRLSPYYSFLKKRQKSRMVMKKK